MNEDFIQHIWQYLLFQQQDLRTTDGKLVVLSRQGQLNLDAGPDFFDGRLYIDNTYWAGNIEIHYKASDWYKHKHNTDAAYDNVILHVVYIADQEIYHKDGSKIPCIELKGRIPKILIDKFKLLKEAKGKIPCAAQLESIEETHWTHWKERLLIERIIEKSKLFDTAVKHNKNDWEFSFFLFMFKYFGAYVNREAFYELARSLPYQSFLRKRDSLFCIEAVLAGQAGILKANHKDAYPKSLYKEYSYWKKVWQLKPLSPFQMKYFRLRPNSFPGIQLSLLASFFHEKYFSFEKIRSLLDAKLIYEMLELKTNTYWDTHYVFDKESLFQKKILSKQSVDRLIINLIVPFSVAWARRYDRQDIVENALDLVSSLKSENNKIIRLFSDLGVGVSSASDSQALIQLHNNYCISKKCLNCNIGSIIINSNDRID